MLLLPTFARCVPGVLLVFAIGCSPSAPPPAPTRPGPVNAAGHGHAEHDHGHDHDHDEPASLGDGIAKLESLGEDLAAKLAESAGEAADDAVHDIGHLLEAVRDLAKKAALPEDRAAAVSKGLDELEDCFGKVDEAFHSGDAKVDPKQVLESVKERVEAAFKAMKEVL